MLGGGGSFSIAPFPSSDLSEPLTGVVPFEFEGAQPAIQSSAKTPFHPNDPCENQDPPNLSSGVASGPETTANPTGASATGGSSEKAQLTRRYAEILGQFGEAEQLRAEGKQAEAERIVAEAVQLFEVWSAEWRALQRENGLNPPRVSDGKAGNR